MRKILRINLPRKFSFGTRVFYKERSYSSWVIAEPVNQISKNCS